MTRKTITTILVMLLLGAQAVSAKKKTDEAQQAEKVRSGVSNLGVGRDSLVEVKLRDNSKVKGYVSEAGDKTFTVVNIKTGAPTVINYPDVTKMKGNNLSTGAKIAIGAGVAAAAIILFIKWAGQFK